MQNVCNDSEFCQIVEFADRHGSGGDWLEILGDRVTFLDRDKHGQGDMLNPAYAQISAEFLDLLRLNQLAVAEFILQEPPIWLLTEMPGNIGDHLIWAGTQPLLATSSIEYVCISVPELRQSSGRLRPGTLLIPGSGALTKYWHEWLPEELVLVASCVFARLVILPSEYDPEVPVVRDALSRPNVYAFAREAESFGKIKAFARAAPALDPALFSMEFLPAQPSARQDEDLGNVLVALRTDASSLLTDLGLRPTQINDDISLTTRSLQEFIERIRNVDTVVTDRLHVVVAAIMAGKHVRFLDPYGNKISRYVRFNFQDEFSGRLQQRDEQWLVRQGFVETLEEQR